MQVKARKAFFSFVYYIMETPEPSDLKRQSFISVMSLFFQSGYSAVLGLIANLTLTILLSPTIFGIYITVLSIISFLNYFSDIGLAASLIQKKELDEQDAKTVFTVQQILILSLIAIGFISTRFIVNFYRLPQEGAYLYWALLFSFFISSLKTIPSVHLERKIQFQKIVLVQILENTVFYVAVSLFAFFKFGLMSFTIAVVLRSLTGLVALYAISPWTPSLGISMKHLKQLLAFGIPFQASSFLALFKDDLIILYLGRVLGFEGLGYIGWAKKWADAPVRIIMDNVAKVTFPLIARFQDQKEKIRRLSEKILHYQTLILAPVYVAAIILMPYFIKLIPKYSKWEPALPFFYIFCISSLIVSLSVPFMNLYNALGKVKITFTYMAFFTTLIWVSTLILTGIYGALGFPIAHLIVSTSFLLIFFRAKKEFGFRLLNFENNIINEIKSLYRNE